MRSMKIERQGILIECPAFKVEEKLDEVVEAIVQKIVSYCDDIGNEVLITLFLNDLKDAKTTELVDLFLDKIPIVFRGFVKDIGIDQKVTKLVSGLEAYIAANC